MTCPPKFTCYDGSRSQKSNENSPENKSNGKSKEELEKVATRVNDNLLKDLSHLIRGNIDPIG